MTPKRIVPAGLLYLAFIGWTAIASFHQVDAQCCNVSESNQCSSYFGIGTGSNYAVPWTPPNSGLPTFGSLLQNQPSSIMIPPEQQFAYSPNCATANQANPMVLSRPFPAPEFQTLTSNIVNLPNGCSNWGALNHPALVPQGFGGSTPANLCSRPKIQFMGGFEALALRVHHDQDVAMVIDPAPGNRLVPFTYGFQFSPRVWLGMFRPGTGGFRASYWYLDDTARRETATAVVNATPIYLFVYGAGGNLTRNAYADLGETMSSIHSARIQSLDFEYLDTFQFRCWNLQSSAGIRLAEIVQNLRGDVYDVLGGLEETVTNDLSIRGVGPTFGLRANRTFQSSPIGIYVSGRGSLLFSQTTQEIYEMKNAGADEVRDRAQQDEIISQCELGLGFQFNYCFSNGIRTFASTGYEVQAWYDVGGPVDSSSTLGLDGLSAQLGVFY
ncbi:MAG: hypothetical protein KDB03_21835 [Planctomycetales bacterium]|nr:hypothetical protein [Planctomycetales bacterium]